MFFLLVLLLVATPLVEIFLLLRLAQAIHWGPTILLVGITGVAGAALARQQGLATWARVQDDLAQGRMPASEIVDGLLIFMAGLLLLTPGIITDAVGFCLLIPPLRRVIKRKTADYLRSRVVTIRHHGTVEDDFIDVEATEVHENGPPRSTLP